MPDVFHINLSFQHHIHNTLCIEAVCIMYYCMLLIFSCVYAIHMQRMPLFIVLLHQKIISESCLSKHLDIKSIVTYKVNICLLYKCRLHSIIHTETETREGSYCHVLCLLHIDIGCCECFCL